MQEREPNRVQTMFEKPDPNTPMPVVVLGRELGTCLTWNLTGCFTICFNTFSAAPNTPLTSGGTLIVDFGTGLFEIVDNNALISSGDLAHLCASLPWRGPRDIIT
jgi:hypothetical protein